MGGREYRDAALGPQHLGVTVPDSGVQSNALIERTQSSRVYHSFANSTALVRTALPGGLATVVKALGEKRILHRNGACLGE